MFIIPDAMMKRLRSIVAVIGVAASSSGSLLAQTAGKPIPAGARSNTLGFVLGAGLEAATHESDNSVTLGAAGIGLTLGYGVTSRFMLLANYSSMGRERGRSLGHVDAMLRVNFRGARSRVRPYIAGGPTFRFYEDSEYDVFTGPRFSDFVVGEYEASGTGGTFAFGLGVFVKPKLAIDANLASTFGGYTQHTFRGEDINFSRVSASSVRFRVGVMWAPGI